LRLEGRAARVADAPAVLGRDPLAEIPLRDPGVSRRHAELTLAADGVFLLTDTGSRLGTFLAGARLGGPYRVTGEADIRLGPSCQLALRPAGPGGLLIRGTEGLDTGLLALVGSGRVPLGDVWPQAQGAWIEFDGRGVSLVHPPELPVRLSGRLAATRIQLLHGDHLELGPTSAPSMFEVT